MVAFTADCPPPSLAARILSGESHAGDVVDAVATSQGCELLAVVSLAEMQKELRLADSTAAVLRRLQMPYEVT
jgi:Mlc titration factor MtfA (ptsG expression regulator)